VVFIEGGYFAHDGVILREVGYIRHWLLVIK
jgi:hypothetical protein